MKWALVMLATNLNGLNVEIKSGHPTQTACVTARKAEEAKPLLPANYATQFICIKNYK